MDPTADSIETATSNPLKIGCPANPPTNANIDIIATIAATALVTCGCTGHPMQFTPARLKRHCSGQRHQKWLKQDSCHLYEQIQLTCPCGGGSFTFATQMNHLKSPVHQKWQQAQPERRDQMPFICQCSQVYPYGQREVHRSDSGCARPDFKINRR